MKIIEHIENSIKQPQFSFEIVPPPRGRSLSDIIEVVEVLEPLNPPWIDVTSHSSNVTYEEMADGSFKKRIHRKRPGTLGICGVIQNRFKIDTVAHVLCLGFTREETEDALIELNFLGIHNVLALRGDAPNYQKEVRKDRTVNLNASDLVKQISSLRQGHFLTEIEDSNPLDFCIGVAGYPEKHFEAPCLKTDIEFLKQKVNAGAEYIVTQMFFDNQKYFEFVKACREEGITVPIIPGLKVLRSEAQLKNLSKTFYIDFPEELVDAVKSSPKNAAEIGKKWAEQQVRGLLEANVSNVHFYVLNDVQTVAELVRKAQK